MRLNPRQEAAALDIDRPVLVAAGAGTGKTRCVVARLLYLLGVEVGGRRIPEEKRLTLRDLAAITFTNAAAADLQRQLREALAAAGRPEEARRVDTAWIGTIHGFCGRILWEFALQVDRPPGLTALDEGESLALGSAAARDALVEAIEQRAVPALDLLLADTKVEDVLRYTARLAADADRLEVIARDPELDAREQALVELSRRALALLRRRLGEQAAIDFDAMIVLARDLLRDRPDVRRVVQRRIRALIVDEYQDVDPAQHQIVWLLGTPESGSAETTRLMLVGDPQQSIFRFRRSDVTLWTRTERALAGGLGAVHVLTENHRSRAPILGFVDSVSGPELDTPLRPGEPLADFEVPYRPLDPTPEHRGVEPAVEILVLPPSEKGTALSGREARALEIPAVAARLRELIEGGREPGDIAILLSAWAEAAKYREALAAQGIRSWMLRNEGFWERREVLDCVVALRAVLDPQDDLALFGFLRGPMIGVRDDTLLAIARAARPPYGRWIETFRSGAAAWTAEPELLEFAAGVWRRARGLRDRVGHDELLQDLLDQTGFQAHFALLGEDGHQASANVQKLLRILHGWRELTLAGVLRAIADLRERDEVAVEGDAPLATRRDAVTITSIHSAKGLQWPIVVWGDLTRAPPNLAWSFLVGRETLRLRSAAAEKVEDDPRFAALRDQEEMEEQAQRKRLWYVAATRARERLILAGVPQGALTRHHDHTPARAIRRLGDLAGETVTYRNYRGEEFSAVIRRVSGPVDVISPSEEPLPVLPVTSLPTPREPIRVRQGRTLHSASELVTFARCQRKHWFIYGMGLREPVVPRCGHSDLRTPDSELPEFLDAVTRGQIVHDVLEELRELDELDLVLEDAIGRWDPETPAPDGVEGERYRARLREEIERVARHPDYRAVADLPGARRELGFVHLLGDGQVMHGVFDLAAPGADGRLEVLDVKTGPAAVLSRKAVVTRAEGYASQRDVYVLAAEAISGRAVGRFAFHFSGSNRQVVADITPELRARSEREVGSMLERIEAGARELTAKPAECRFCGFRAVGWCEGVRG